MSIESVPIIRNPYNPLAPAARRPRYACPEHGPLGSNEYDLDHRCTHCGRPILAIRKLRERHDSLALPRHDLERILDECRCAHTANALRELMEAHDEHL
ncbi:hypothetical protein [Halomonas stenophila]|uniref:Uncharacterized protein n=1 Tax=Halomonas stenophila TaxID=795312 RepID=A0A7W5HM03_9GAMM|nr:hypothetical protein [Halomonas stenophila]MBB3231733.1 hypothetical protein [Halomonas stenophila]